MSFSLTRPVPGAVLLALLAVPGTGLVAGSHLWRINEIFSNADGTVQFVELHEILGAPNETRLSGHDLFSEATDTRFVLSRNLTGSTSDKYLLFATAGFAALPGAPAPDFIIPDGLFAVDGDTIWWSTIARYDRFTFGAGDLPLDGVRSIHLTKVSSGPNDEFTTGVNSPTNFRGETGSIDISVVPPEGSFTRGDCDDDGSQNITDAIYLLTALFLEPRPLPCRDTCDANDDGGLDISDAVAILVSLFVDPRPLPAPNDCGVDPTEDSLDCASFAGCLGSSP